MTVGECSRNFIAAHLIGLPAIVQAVRDSPLSNYYIHGYWDHMTADSLKYAVVAALSGRVVDAALILILEDDRLAGRGHELEAAMQEEWAWLTAIPDDTWERLSRMVSEVSPPENLRADCILAAQASYAFLHWRLLRILAMYPWKLCDGTVGERLAELRSLPDALGCDDTTDKIYHLMHVGYSIDKIAAAVELMKQCPFSTRGVEQAHASIAIIARLHPGVGLDHMTARGLLHAARPLFHDPDANALSKAIGRLRGKVSRLEKKSGAGRTGRQLFLSEMVPRLCDLRTAPLARRAGAQWSMVHHGQMWARLTDEEKAMYEEKARVRRDAFFADIAEEVAEVQGEIRRKQKLLEEQKRGLGLSPVTLSGNRLTEDDIQAMSDHSDTAEFGKTSVLVLRKKAVSPQPMIPDHEMDFLSKTNVRLAGFSTPGMCGWFRHVAFLRDEFYGTVLVLNLGTPREQCFLFSFALQKPIILWQCSDSRSLRFCT